MGQTCLMVVAPVDGVNVQRTLFACQTHLHPDRGQAVDLARGVDKRVTFGAGCLPELRHAVRGEPEEGGAHGDPAPLARHGVNRVDDQVDKDLL